MVLRNFRCRFSVTDWRWGLGLLDWLRVSFGTGLILWLVKRWSLLHWLNSGSFNWNLCALVTEGSSGLLGNVRDTLNHGPSIFLDDTCVNEADFLLELFLGSFHTLSWTQTASLGESLLNQFFLTTLLKSGSKFISSFDRTYIIVHWRLIVVNLRSENSLLSQNVLLFHSLMVEFLEIPLMLIVKGNVVITSIVIILFVSQDFIVSFLEGLWSKS